MNALDPPQRLRAGAPGRSRDRVRPRFRLRPAHVALGGAGVRGRLPGDPLRPRRRRRGRPLGVRRASGTRRCRATPTTSSRSAASSTSTDGSSSATRSPSMIGVLADAAAPELFDAAGDDRPVAALHRRRGLRRRLQRGRHPRAARVAREQLPRLVERDGAGDHGQPRPPRARRRADRELLPHRPRPSPAGSPRSPSCPTTAPTCPRCRTPTLVLQCTQDAIAPVEVGEYVADDHAGRARW